MTTPIEIYFDSVVDALEKKLKDKKTARRLLVYETARIGRKLFDKKYASAWTGVFMPFEIFQAMDVGAVYVEYIGAMLAGTGQAPEFLRKAERFGYSPDGCAYHRALVGAALDSFIGRPELLIGATAPCDGGLKTILNLGENIGLETFVIDIPYPPVTREKTDYLVKQFRGMIDYITEFSGKKYDPDRMKESIRYSNEATRIIRELYELCTQKPAPITSDTLKNFQIIFALLLGTKEGVEVAQVFLDEAKQHLKNGCADLPKEDIRLLWVQNRIQYKTKLIDYLQENYNAKIVIDELNYIYWDDMDEDRPLEALAIRLISHPLNGKVGHRIDILKKLCEDYAIDGAVNPSHWGCRQNCGVREIIKSDLAKIGVPMINLDVDCVDSRNYSEGQLLTRLQGFMEMIES